jgi:hypothetical protein
MINTCLILLPTVPDPRWRSPSRSWPQPQGRARAKR